MSAAEETERQPPRVGEQLLARHGILLPCQVFPQGHTQAINDCVSKPLPQSHATASSRDQLGLAPVRWRNCFKKGACPLTATQGSPLGASELSERPYNAVSASEALVWSIVSDVRVDQLHGGGREEPASLRAAVWIGAKPVVRQIAVRQGEFHFRRTHR